MTNRYNELKQILHNQKCFKAICGAGNENIIQVVQYIVPELSGFTYYNDDYDGESTLTALTGPVSPNLIRLIDITVATDKDINKVPPPVSISTKVSTRNLKDNF